MQENETEESVLASLSGLIAGLVALPCLVLLAVTGIWLRFFYSPSSTAAWDDIEAIQDQIAAGLLARNLHEYGYLLTWVTVAIWAASAIPRRSASSLQRRLATAALGLLVLATLVGRSGDLGLRPLHEVAGGLAIAVTVAGIGSAIRDIAAR